MKQSATILDWISVVGPILFSWPFVIFTATLYFRKPLLKLLENFSETNINKAKIGPVELQEDQLQSKHLQFLVNCLVTEPELAHLNQIRGTAPFEYEKTDHLKAELRRLCSLGMVQVDGDLEDLPSKGDLKEHVRLTDRGRQYLEMREQLAGTEE